MFKERYFIFQEGPDPMADIFGEAKRRKKEAPKVLDTEERSRKEEDRAEREAASDKEDKKELQKLEKSLSEDEYMDTVKKSKETQQESKEKVQQTVLAINELAKEIDPNVVITELQDKDRSRLEGKGFGPVMYINAENPDEIPGLLKGYKIKFSTSALVEKFKSSKKLVKLTKKLAKHNAQLFDAVNEERIATVNYEPEGQSFDF